jgi:hypothetical protein
MNTNLIHLSLFLGFFTTQGGSGFREFSLRPQTSNLRLPTEWENGVQVPAEMALL